MEGAVHAEQRKIDREIALAYNIMAIDRDNQKGMMKPLSKYLKVAQQVTEQTADEVAAIFQSLKAKGKSVKIRKRER